MSRQKKMKQYALYLIILAFGFAAFSFGVYLVKRGTERQPASIDRDYDYSQLKGENLQIAARNRLIEGAKLIQAGASIGVELGHFLTKNTNGNTSGACEVYNHIRLTFAAGDMAVNGEAPEMIIDNFCRPTNDLSGIAPVMIHVEEILNSPVQDKTVFINDPTNKFATDSDAKKITFKNVSDTWPRIWVLRSAKLYNESGQELLIDAQDIKTIRGKPITMDWHQAN